jgi:hypothetical protein
VSKFGAAWLEPCSGPSTLKASVPATAVHADLATSPDCVLTGQIARNHHQSIHVCSSRHHLHFNLHSAAGHALVLDIHPSHLPALQNASHSKHGEQRLQFVAATISKTAHHQCGRGSAGLLVQSVHCLPVEMEPHRLHALAGESNPRAV